MSDVFACSTTWRLPLFNPLLIYRRNDEVHSGKHLATSHGNMNASDDDMWSEAMPACVILRVLVDAQLVKDGVSRREL